MIEIKCKKRIGYPDTIPDRIEFIDRIATDRGRWLFFDYHESTGMMHYYRRINGFDYYIDVYLTKMSVKITIIYPKSWKWQIYRKDIDVQLLKAIFYNPRISSILGYY